MPNDITRSLLTPNVESVIARFLPDHIISDHPRLVDFIRAYLRYLEEDHGAGYFANTLPQQRDIRTQDKEFLRRIELEIGLFVPRDYAADPQLFYDKISDLWRSKGSAESIETFFRLFLNDPVQVRLPWDLVLKPSDGVWIEDDIIRVTSIAGNPEEFAGTRIVQSGTFASAVVSRVDRKVYSDSIIFELVLLKGSVVGEFFERSIIISESDEGIRGEVYRSFSGLNIADGGTGYAIGDQIFIKGGDGISFRASVSRVDEDTGEILDTVISDFGSGNTPNHILNAPSDDLYFLADFLLFEREEPNNQVGPSEVEIIIESFNGIGGDLTLNFSPILRSEGSYVGSRGQLSDAIVLQDSFFYQRYSYEVLTNTPISIWGGSVKRTISPAGTIPFANLRVSEQFRFVTQAQLFSSITIPGIYDIKEETSVSFTLLGFVQDYVEPSEFYFADDYVGESAFLEQATQGNDQTTETFTTEEI